MVNNNDIGISKTFSNSGTKYPNTTSLYTQFTIKSTRENKEYTYNLYEIAGFYAYDILEDFKSVYLPTIKLNNNEFDCSGNNKTTLKEFHKKLSAFIKVDIGGQEVDIDDLTINKYMPIDIREKVFQELLEVNFGFLELGENSPLSFITIGIRAILNG